MTGRLDTDVIVVGAGPVGLVLTGELRLNGVRAITLERLPEPTGESRASILHARTMSLFAERGVLDWLGPVPEGGPWSSPTLRRHRNLIRSRRPRSPASSGPAGFR